MVLNSKVVGGALAAAMVAPGVLAAPANQNDISGLLQLRDVEFTIERRAALAEALAMAETDPSLWGTLFKDGSKLLGGLLGSGSSSSQGSQQQKAHRRDADPVNWGKIGHAVKDVGCAVGTFIPGVDVAVDTACLASSAVHALKKHGKRDALANPMAEPEAIAEAIAMAYAEANPNFMDTLMNVEKRTPVAEAKWLKTIENVGKKLFHYGPDVINGGNQLYQQSQQPHKRDASPEAEAKFVNALKPIGKGLFHELPNYISSIGGVINGANANHKRADHEFESLFAREAEYEDLYTRDAFASPDAMAAAFAEAFPEADPSIWSSIFKVGGKLLSGLTGGGNSGSSKQRRDVDYAYEIFAREAEADPSVGSLLARLEPVGMVRRDAYADAAANALAEAFAEADPSLGSLITKALPYVKKGLKSLFHEAPNYISSIGSVATQAQANKQQQQKKREEELYHDLFIRDPELFSYDSYGYEY